MISQYRSAPLLSLSLALVLVSVAACAHSTSSASANGPSPASATAPAAPNLDSRYGLRAGKFDAAESVWNLRVLS